VAICAPCLEGLPRATCSCSTCALPLAQAGACGACQKRAPPWDFACAGLRYEFPVDVLVGLLKFRRCLAAGPVLARCMAQAAVTPAVTADLLVPVPLHWTRLAARGYNQSLELARALSVSCGLPVDCRSLRRRRRTPAQTGLDAETRRRNLRDAFTWQGPPLHQRSVLLVDDVMTTGSTAAACARVLRCAGAARVGVWVAARADIQVR
jgi:ComF family protein